jgi:hypothetical protein
MPLVDQDEEDGPDDSDISPAAVIADVIKKPKGRVTRKAEGGGLCSTALAEDLEADSEPMEPQAMEDAGNLEEGRSKRARKLNRLYLGWLYHNDSDDSEVEHGMDAGS